MHPIGNSGRAYEEVVVPKESCRPGRRSRDLGGHRRFSGLAQVLRQHLHEFNGRACNTARDDREDKENNLL
jgi:hypothetical protein